MVKAKTFRAPTTSAERVVAGEGSGENNRVGTMIIVGSTEPIGLLASGDVTACETACSSDWAGSTRARMTVAATAKTPSTTSSGQARRFIGSASSTSDYPLCRLLQTRGLVSV